MGIILLFGFGAGFGACAVILGIMLADAATAATVDFYGKSGW